MCLSKVGEAQESADDFTVGCDVFSLPAQQKNLLKLLISKQPLSKLDTTSSRRVDFPHLGLLMSLSSLVSQSLGLLVFFFPQPWAWSSSKEREGQKYTYSPQDMSGSQPDFCLIQMLTIRLIKSWVLLWPGSCLGGHPCRAQRRKQFETEPQELGHPCLNSIQRGNRNLKRIL